MNMMNAAEKQALNRLRMAALQLAEFNQVSKKNKEILSLVNERTAANLQVKNSLSEVRVAVQALQATKEAAAVRSAQVLNRKAIEALRRSEATLRTALQPFVQKELREESPASEV